MIRRVILLGAGPRGGEAMTFIQLSVDKLGAPVALLMGAFFTPSEASQAAGLAYTERLKLRTADRDAPISKKAAGAQLGTRRHLLTRDTQSVAIGADSEATVEFARRASRRRTIFAGSRVRGRLHFGTSEDFVASRLPQLLRYFVRTRHLARSGGIRARPAGRRRAYRRP